MTSSNTYRAIVCSHCQAINVPDVKRCWRCDSDITAIEPTTVSQSQLLAQQQAQNTHQATTFNPYESPQTISASSTDAPSGPLRPNVLRIMVNMLLSGLIGSALLAFLPGSDFRPPFGWPAFVTMVVIIAILGTILYNVQGNLIESHKRRMLRAPAKSTIFDYIVMLLMSGVILVILAIASFVFMCLYCVVNGSGISFH
jgi:hypothetical protein